MGQLPFGVSLAIDFRPTPVLTKMLAILLVDHQKLGGDPGHITVNLDLYIGGHDGQFPDLSKILLQSIFKCFKIRKSGRRKDVENHGITSVESSQVIQAFLLPRLHMLTMQIE